MAKERNVWADSLKGWLMVLVILGHAIQTEITDDAFNSHLWNIIYSFHMPAFMAVSGWFAFHSYKNKGSFVCYMGRRAKQLLVPFFVWSLIQFAKSGNYSVENLSRIVTCPDAYFWFLWVLFWICCLFRFCQWLAMRLKLDEINLVLFVGLLLLGIMVGFDLRLFGFQLLAYYFIFYTVGYCIHRFRFLLVSNNSLLIVLTIIWFVLAWYWKMHELPMWIPFSGTRLSIVMQYLYRGLTALFAILVLLPVSQKNLNGENGVNRFMSHIGELSLGVYVSHLIVMGYLNRFVHLMIADISPTIAIIVVSVLSFVIATFMVELFSKNSYSSRILLGKF